MIIFDGLPDDYNIPIPLLPVNFKIKYTGTYYGGSFFEYALKYKYFNPGENGIINHSEPISLSYPADKDSIISGNTVFKITDNYTGGVYMYEFYSLHSSLDSKFFRLFTTRTEVNFSDIISRGFEFIPYSRYYWWVSKLPEFQDVNDLLNSPYVTNTKYNSTQMTERRTFISGT